MMILDVHGVGKMAYYECILGSTETGPQSGGGPGPCAAVRVL